VIEAKADGADPDPRLLHLGPYACSILKVVE